MTSVQSVRVDWSCPLRLIAVMAREKTLLMNVKFGWGSAIDEMIELAER